MNDEPSRPTGMKDPVLDIRNLAVSFPSEAGEVRAVDGVSLAVRRGRTTTLVGESGSGKSMTAYAVLRLIDPPGRIASGSIRFYPATGGVIDVTALEEDSGDLFRLRGGRIGMIFQEPMTALSPVHTVADQIGEAIRLHEGATRKQALRRAVELLAQVGIPAPERRARQYPFELSGGMRQRVMIAVALACRPELVIADEPTTALDVTLQAQILRLMRSLQRDGGTSILLITHDMGVVAQASDDVAVMYLGRIVESAPTRTLLRRPRHPYTRGLLRSLPLVAPRKARLPSIEGSVPAAAERPPGCPFHPRCPHARSGLCDRGAPPALERVGEDHGAACFRLNEIGGGP